MAAVDRKSLHVEISAETMVRLLAAEQVCAADFRCLDCRSKLCLQRLCLESCTKRVPSDRKVLSTLCDSDPPRIRHSKKAICKSLLNQQKSICG